MTERREVTIERLGAHADGVASGPRGDTFVPFALPGERWMIGGDAPAERLSVSADRAQPICQHFTTCGGCSAQHMAPALYAAWKRSSISLAFAHRGLDVDVQPLTAIRPRSRRRAFMGIERGDRDVRVGFREEGEHTLVDINECPVLDPVIVAALPVLKDMALIAMPSRSNGRLIITKLDHGLDVSFDNGVKVLKPEARQKLAEMCKQAGIIRLIVSQDPIAEHATPTLTIGGVAIAPPQSIFLQAVPEAEALLIDLVTAALPAKAKRIADLFCGIGTFTLPLARKVKVLAVDSEKRALDALQFALNHASGLKPVDVLKRDLFREPLSARELDGVDAVVIDPPRAGAAEQCMRIAKSKVKTVIAVSCAPATLARDARTLIDAGFKIGPVTPIDQFLYTPHTEAFTVFTR
jgi:23S rRNA (uracil1939-C5)-methyltransferase